MCRGEDVEYVVLGKYETRDGFTKKTLPTCLCTASVTKPLAVPMKRKHVLVVSGSATCSAKCKVVTLPYLGSRGMLVQEKRTVSPIIDEIVTAPPAPVIQCHDQQDSNPSNYVYIPPAANMVPLLDNATA